MWSLIGRSAICVIISMGFTTQGWAAASVEQFRAMFKQMNELDAKGDYEAALVVTRKFEAASKEKFGADSAGHAEGLNNLAVAYSYLGRYLEAADILKQSRAIYAREKGPGHPFVLLIDGNVATVLSATGDLKGAEEAADRALAGYQHLNDKAKIGESLAAVSEVYLLEGRYEESERVGLEAVSAFEKSGSVSVKFGRSLESLGNVYVRRGKLREADAVFQRSIAVQEKASGPSHPFVGSLLNNYANVLMLEHRNDEAERFLRRSLSIAEKVKAESPSVATNLANLGRLRYQAGAYAEADALLRRGISIHQKSGLKGLDLALLFDLQGLNFFGWGKYDEAEAAAKQALAIRETVSGPNHPMVSSSLYTLGKVARVQGRYDEAEAYLTRADDIMLASYGETDENTIVNDIEFIKLLTARGDLDRALKIARKTTASANTNRSNQLFMEAMAGDRETAKDTASRIYVSTLAAIVSRDGKSTPETTGEAIEVAQYVDRSSAGAAIQQMAARFASGNDALAALVRQDQDQSGLLRAANRALVDALLKTGEQRDQTLIDLTRKQIAEAESKLRVVKARVDKEFPDYAALADPKPLKPEELQRLLGPDEALVFWLTDGVIGDTPDPASRKETYLFAMTHDDMEWHTIRIGVQQLTDKVSAFRHGLDVEGFEASGGKEAGALFNLDLAHEMYETLLGPVDGLIRNKKNLLVVPSGALTALPFHLLLTEAPASGSGSFSAERYREAPWLIKRQAVTVLPAVASLHALRAFLRPEPAPKPLIGFGDPQFGPDEEPANKREVASRSVTRSYTDFWQGAGVDRQTLAFALPRLEDTADELRTVANRLGAATEDIHLRADANETTVKKANLANYRIVYFATHGLVAGDVKGIAEPSLALSIPKVPTELDDGLLTASEVSQLKLNADWVVLSACNTIAGDKPGAEALSGLARAFFYSGARALLVSHWSVASDAATRLTTSTFEKIRSDANVGRAEALRRAMLDYLGDPSSPNNAYPAYWGPFAIVGEGGMGYPK